MIKAKTILSNLKQPTFFFVFVFIIVILGTILRLSHLPLPNQYIFDEDYFAFTASLIARNQITAYQYWHPPFDQLTSFYLYRPPAVEWLHPPLSKLLIAALIGTIGNNPWGWRLLPALSGVILVIIVMVLTIKLFPQQKLVALLTGLLVATDHLLVVESRLAGANMILTALTTLTVLLTFLFWRKQSQTENKKISWFYLSLLGLSAGLTVATKWSGVFMILGCIVWLLVQIRSSQVKFKIKLVVKIITSLTLISLAIYVLSYSQFFWLSKFDVKAWLNLQSAMLTFQTTTSEQHVFQSRPWQWPLNQVTIPYFLPTRNNTSGPEIWASSYGLPLGFLALFLTLVVPLLVKKNKLINSGEILLVLAVLCYWLPWFFVPRNLFLYQIIPAMPLLFILLSHRLIDLTQFLVNRLKRSRSLVQS